DPLQVLAARAAGADAVLLIARVLEPDELSDLLGRVRELGAEALVECHDERDVAAAQAAGAALVGVNSRDLETLAVDASAPRRLLPLAAAFALAVAESGIRARADVLDLAACGAQAFLVGGALLQADDPAAALRLLRGEAP
ncbi:MAG: indole-3-glycerol-phosphate synthase TrpC, partial [Candidatus Latescibacteria bacterium]|nr:indole-3-glycerol-phosphate synthase TrpC [Candidatus Latescibacterota bacterium]